jgi:hypothetical protein
MFVEEVVRRQAGVISRAQARAGGMSDDQVDRRIADRHWRVVHRGVFLVRDRDFGAEARIRAAALVEITVPRTSGMRRGRGVRVRRRDLPAVDRVAMRGLALTDVPLTVLEAAVALGGVDRA